MAYANRLSKAEKKEKKAEKDKGNLVAEHAKEVQARREQMLVRLVEMEERKEQCALKAKEAQEKYEGLMPKLPEVVFSKKLEKLKEAPERLEKHLQRQAKHQEEAEVAPPTSEQLKKLEAARLFADKAARALAGASAELSSYRAKCACFSGAAGGGGGGGGAAGGGGVGGGGAEAAPAATVGKGKGKGKE
jgi:hypothetical protein